MQTKVKSFTLSELLVVMIITAIVVGLAFSVLDLVQKQIKGIEKNYKKTTELSLFEQRLWQDFNQHNKITYSGEKLLLISDIDTVLYDFTNDFTLRNTDTIDSKLAVDKLFYEGKEVEGGYIDAISISGDKELPNYSIFVFAKMDAAHYMNKNGF